ncbi:dyslexia-associated protein KIAA0319-like protein [Stegodyphus dumicola]|uniref:dyslexia-associated protein KIAA0319-like protein n=1 Tax=Stegodyphus dumicola TaxID=202533 RepID=UPI0015B1BDF8|nr:dyslexia-associated protein KIAA0319-like protein [Stegodyphus dumicola]
MVQTACALDRSTVWFLQMNQDSPWTLILDIPVSVKSWEYNIIPLSSRKKIIKTAEVQCFEQALCWMAAHSCMFSTDDDKIVKYQWEVLEVPIGYSVQLNETPTLQLKNLIPGFYRFKLTVMDSKGAMNSTFANVTVQKETDYPPTANAKSEVVIYLPQNEVTLNGNLSTDDKGIKSWEWKKSPDTDKAVDMEGTNGPYLHLSQLEVGVYKFILKVTDTADQTSTTEVHLFVKPESNTPPIANAGPDQKITLPLQSPVILNGSGSKDDIKITKWKWEQIA